MKNSFRIWLILGVVVVLSGCAETKTYNRYTGQTTTSQYSPPPLVPIGNKA